MSATDYVNNVTAGDQIHFNKIMFYGIYVHIGYAELSLGYVWHGMTNIPDIDGMFKPYLWSTITKTD